MPGSDSLEASILDLLFLNTDFQNIGDAAGLQNSTVAGAFYISLHTASPGEAGDQTTNETAYTNYARVAVARTAGGWTRTANSIANTAAISFAACGVTGATLSHFGVGTASAGAGVLLWYGTLTAPLIVSSGVAPSFGIAALTVTND